MTATEAARRFAALLDDVERTGESVVVERRGRPVASIGPAAAASGRALKDVLATHRRDAAWAEELRELRGALSAEQRRWND